MGKASRKRVTKPAAEKDEEAVDEVVDEDEDAEDVVTEKIVINLGDMEVKTIILNKFNSFYTPAMLTAGGKVGESENGCGGEAAR